MPVDAAVHNGTAVVRVSVSADTVAVAAFDNVTVEPIAPVPLVAVYLVPAGMPVPVIGRLSCVLTSPQAVDVKAVDTLAVFEPLVMLNFPVTFWVHSTM